MAKKAKKKNAVTNNDSAAEDTSVSESTSAPENGGEAGTNLEQQLFVHRQYVKDLSFENPDAPKVLMDQGDQPNIEININVTARPVEGENRMFEVVLAIRATASREEKKVFLAELSYAVVLSVSESVAENALHPIMMIEGPRIIFPFARAILSEVTQAGGFMPLNLQPIDFVRVYQQGMQAQQQAEQKSDDA